VDVAAYVALGLMTALTAGWTFFVPSRAKRLNRALASRERNWISLAQGAVKVTGTIHRAAEILKAPLTGRKCVLYELIVVTRLFSGGRPFWRRVVDVICLGSSDQ
jgi:hypothetical protein